MFLTSFGSAAGAINQVFPGNARRLNILVTGGAGFLGLRLCRLLIGQGHTVLCLDNLQTGSLQNVQDLIPDPAFRFLRHDVIDRIEIADPLDQIYNLACPASPPQYQRDPVHTFKTCVIGALNLLDLAKSKQARILQASTSEVYGDPSVSPQPESYFGNVNTVGPRSCYDEGKRAAETLFHDYGEHHGVVTKIARIFNTYGPDMRPDDGRVVSNFIVQALRGEVLTVYGDGRQTRSFCFRDDLISGLVALMNSAPHISHPVNLGNPGEFTIRELAEQILQKTGSPSRLVFCDLPVDDPRQRRPDISVAARDLGWAPTISLSDGLDMTISHFRREAMHSLHSVGVMS